jgi:hypothetical protein
VKSESGHGSAARESRISVVEGLGAVVEVEVEATVVDVVGVVVSEVLGVASEVQATTARAISIR